MSFWSTIVDDARQALAFASGQPLTPAQAAQAAQSGVAPPSAPAFLTVVEGIWTQLTDGRMWRSLGWLLLGIILMLLAVAWWIGPSAARRSPLGLAAEGLS